MRPRDRSQLWGAEELVVRSVYPGGGAAEAGLEVGDVIVDIAGRRGEELGFDAAVALIRGPSGTCVRLNIRRGGSGELGELIVSRRRLS